MSFPLRHTLVLDALLVSILCSTVVFAQSPNLRITEVMYDAEGSDSGKEYIEVFNTGPEDIVMTDIVLSEHERSHTIRPWRGSTTLKPGESALIADRPELFLEEYTFDGTVFDSTFNLNNTGSTLQLLYQGQELHTLSYTRADGAVGDGNALHVSRNDTLSAQSPSPGSVRGIPVKKPEPSETLSETKEETIALVRNPEVVFATSASVFSLQKTTKNKEEFLYGSWNFGDGTSRFADVVEHTYQHPGTYLLVFQEYDRRRRPTDRTVQQEIEVLLPHVTIERIDNTFVRLTNNHSFTLDVSDWKLVTGETTFTFPEQSRITANNTITVPLPQVTPPDHRILFVTKGGGQFEGTAPKEEPVQPAPQDPRPEPTPTPEQPETQVETPPTKQQLFLWLALLLGIAAITLTPLFFLTRAKKKKK